MLQADVLKYICIQTFLGALLACRAFTPLSDCTWINTSCVPYVVRLYMKHTACSFHIDLHTSAYCDGEMSVSLDPLLYVFLPVTRVLKLKLCSGGTLHVTRLRLLPTQRVKVVSLCYHGCLLFVRKLNIERSGNAKDTLHDAWPSSTIFSKIPPIYRQVITSRGRSIVLEWGDYGVLAGSCRGTLRIYARDLSWSAIRRGCAGTHPSLSPP